MSPAERGVEAILDVHEPDLESRSAGIGAPRRRRSAVSARKVSSFTAPSLLPMISAISRLRRSPPKRSRIAWRWSCGQPCDRGAHLVGAVVLLGVQRGVGAGVGEHPRFELDPARTAALPRDQVARDAIEPRRVRNAAPLEARKLLDRLGKGCCGHVVGLLHVVGECVDVGVDLVDVALVERRERRSVTLRGQDLQPLLLELRSGAMRHR